MKVSSLVESKTVFKLDPFDVVYIDTQSVDVTVDRLGLYSIRVKGDGFNRYIITKYIDKNYDDTPSWGTETVKYTKDIDFILDFRIVK